MFFYSLRNTAWAAISWKWCLWPSFMIPEPWTVLLSSENLLGNGKLLCLFWGTNTHDGAKRSLPLVWNQTVSRLTWWCHNCYDRKHELPRTAARILLLIVLYQLCMVHIPSIRQPAEILHLSRTGITGSLSFMSVLAIWPRLLCKLDKQFTETSPSILFFFKQCLWHW